MSRFFKSAAFPILIVVVLAFFAQRLISPERGDRRRPTSRRFLQQVDSGAVKPAEMRQKDNTVKVALDDGTKYEVGFVDAVRRDADEHAARRRARRASSRTSTSRAASPTAGCRC